jgi:hypothetical protein
MALPAWRKSSRSILGDYCVEWRPIADGVEMRDSKDPAQITLRFSRPAWRDFVASVRTGDFD